MTREELMAEIDADEDEFDELYDNILDEVRHHGTYRVEKMLTYVEQELTAGRENIE